MIDSAEGADSREQVISEDLLALSLLEDIGLIVADTVVSEKRLAIRAIQKVEGQFIDLDDEPKTKDRWAVEIDCGPRYPAKPPKFYILQVSTPLAKDFLPKRSLARRLFSIFSTGRYRKEWTLPDEYSAKLKRPADFIVAFSWALNPLSTSKVLLENQNTFLFPPLSVSEGVTYFVNKALSSREAKPTVSDTAAQCSDTNETESVTSEVESRGDSVQDFDLRSPRASASYLPTNRRIVKKFEIRSEEDSLVVVRCEIPSDFRLLPQHKNLEADDILFVRQGAVDQINRHIGWGQRNWENIHEQGGLLIGERCCGRDGKEFAIVTEALSAATESRSSVYVKFDHAAWNSLINKHDHLKQTSPGFENTSIIGWYHTHPNNLDCFMSGTDLATQRSIFYRPWNYAIVLNPHRELIVAFVGAQAKACGLAIVK